jgi:hypothetical protein
VLEPRLLLRDNWTPGLFVFCLKQISRNVEMTFSIAKRAQAKKHLALMRSNVASWPHEQTWPRVGHHYAKQIAAAKQRSGESRQANVDVGADDEHRCDHKRHQRCRQKKNDAVRGAEHETGHAGTYQKDSDRIPTLQP